MSLLLDEIAIATARLAEAGVESPRTDAELIAAHLHGVSRGRSCTWSPDTDFDPRFWDDIARREAREPLQHITGHAYFRYLELAVGPGVFVPRQETEVMTGWAIEQLAAMDVAEPVVADLGTGSGAIALSIAQEVPRARVHAVEADPLARQWTERNIASVRRGLAAHRGPGDAARRGLCRRADRAWTAWWTWWSATRPTSRRAPGCRPRWGSTTRRPRCGAGRTAWTRFGSSRQTARRLLRPGGLVAVEHGAQQGAAVYWVFAEESGWRETRNHCDLAGRDRFVTAARP